MTDPVSSALITGASQVGGALINQAFAKRNAKIQKKNQMDLMDYQNDINRQNIVDEKTLERQSLENAGLSTASIDGNASTSLAVSGGSASAPETPQVSFDMAGIYQAITQAKKNNEEARAKRIENDRSEAEDEYFRNKVYLGPKFFTDPVTGKELTEEEVNSWNAEAHGGMLPETNIRIPGPKYKNKGAWSAEQSDLDAAVRSFQRDEEINEAKLKAQILKLQGADKEIVQALVDMPKESFRNLVKSTGKLIAETDFTKKNRDLVISEKKLKDFELQAAQDTSIAGLIAKIKDPSASFGDKLTSVLGIIATGLMRYFSR